MRTYIYRVASLCAHIYIGWRIYVYIYIYRVAYLCVHVYI